jgi:hypothetical protein
MGWPQATDYNEVLQTPALCFRDADLRQSAAAVDVLGLPRPRSGNFADVYELRDAASGQAWAVKCFTREVHGLHDRYRAISAHLAETQLSFMVEFAFLDEGVRVKGSWYPVVKMRWVEGLTLSEFVRGHADRPAHLEQLAGLWLRLAQQLTTAQMAHGDLQHGNVLLISGSKANSLRLRLIDYDGMFVPALADRPSGELGHPNYQHPERLRTGAYHGEVDRFSHLVIFTALRSLIAGGSDLWGRHDNGENLLFREKDFQQPAASGLFRELWQSDNADVQALTGHLLLAAQGPLAEVPLLEDVWLSSGAKPLTPDQRARVEAALAKTEYFDSLSEALAEVNWRLADEEEPALEPILQDDEERPWWQSPEQPPLPAPRPAPAPAEPVAPAAAAPKPVAAPPVPGSILPNWGAAGPPIRYQSFWLPRRGRTAAQYRQAFAADVDRGRFALAGGVREGRFVALWARLLADGFLASSSSPMSDCASWLAPLQRRWADEVKTKQTSYSFATLLQQGVFASFIGVATYRAGRGQTRWQAVAGGDCGMVLVRDRALVAAFPQRRSDEIEASAGWLGSRTQLNEELELAFLRGGDRCEANDQLIVTSGAMLAWFQRQIEAGQKPWDALERLAAVPVPQNAFAAWVEWLRDHGGLANDDVTLLTARL